MDWTDCPAIEQVPGRMSGAPVLRHTRIRAEDIVANADAGAGAIAAEYSLPVDDVRTILAFWNRHGAELPMEYFPPEMIEALGADIDWTKCPGVTHTSGHPTIDGTNVRPIDLIANRGEGEDWLLASYGLPVEAIRSVLRRYDRHKRHLAPAA